MKQQLDKGKSAAVANLMRAMIRFVLEDLRKEVAFPVKGRLALCRCRERDNVFIEVGVVFEKIKDTDAKPLDVLNEITTGTKCWHTWRDDTWPRSGFSGSQQGYRLSIDSFSRSTVTEEPPEEKQDD